MKKYWELFITFAKLGLFTFGGGYAMLPLLESEIVDKKKWATYDAREYGGELGKSPGVTPKMPPLAGMENVTTTWRDVTVIKYYEEYSTDKETGKTRSS